MTAIGEAATGRSRQDSLPLDAASETAAAVAVGDEALSGRER